MQEKARVTTETPRFKNAHQQFFLEHAHRTNSHPIKSEFIRNQYKLNGVVFSTNSAGCNDSCTNERVKINNAFDLLILWMFQVISFRFLAIAFYESGSSHVRVFTFHHTYAFIG